MAHHRINSWLFFLLILVKSPSNDVVDRADVGLDPISIISKLNLILYSILILVEALHVESDATRKLELQYVDVLFGKFSL